MQFSDPSKNYHDEIGFSLMPGANSTPVSFQIVRVFDDPAKPIVASPISESVFEAIGAGWGESEANPNHENLFAKYEVAQCGYYPDTIIKHVFYKGGLVCSPVDDLWRLAYSEYPYYDKPAENAPKIGNTSNPNGPGPGWAKEKHLPSEGQQAILKQYGVEFWNDIIHGENAFHLLHDMQDPTWVSTYSGS
jgi:hypothetical protein